MSFLKVFFFFKSFANLISKFLDMRKIFHCVSCFLRFTYYSMVSPKKLKGKFFGHAFFSVIFFLPNFKVTSYLLIYSEIFRPCHSFKNFFCKSLSFFPIKNFDPRNRLHFCSARHVPAMERPHVAPLLQGIHADMHTMHELLGALLVKEH